MVHLITAVELAAMYEGHKDRAWGKPLTPKDFVLLWVCDPALFRQIMA